MWSDGWRNCVDAPKKARMASSPRLQARHRHERLIIYSANADADRALIRDVLGFPHVDVGYGSLIFALPASEIAVHPADTNGGHEIYLMVEDVKVCDAEMTRRGVVCTAPQDRGLGVLTQLSLPGGGQLGVYQPRHARPTW